MPNKDSTQYAAIHTNKYLADARDKGSRVVGIPFDHTVASDAQNDTVNLCVIPAYAKVVDLCVANEALGASTTLSIGDAGSATRYLAATAVTSAGKNQGLLAAGQNYEPTSDTIVFATWGGATPTNGARISGCLFVIMAAGA